MNINSINSALAPSALSGETKTGAAGKASGNSSFGSLVKDTLESIETTQKGAEQEISRAVTGESPDLHKTIIALQTADLKFQFGLQVRNKVIGAYEEIMRMQV